MELAPSPALGTPHDCSAALGSASCDSHNKRAQHDHMRLDTVLTMSIKMNFNVIFVVGLKSGAKNLNTFSELNLKYIKRAIHFCNSGFPLHMYH